MAQLNVTLNQEEMLQLLSENREGAFAELLQNNLNSILLAESEAQLHAKPYERTEERQDSRNGMREKDLVTRIGKITLNVPRHRNVPFKSMIFDNYTRSEASLITTMAEMVVAGVSTRKVSRVMETLCGQSYSKSTVSEVCKDLDKNVEEFRTRQIAEPYPFVIVDGTYLKVRENHHVISKPLMIAIGISADGRKTVLGFDYYENESKETWTDFLQSLKNRGLDNIKVITSDAHEGIIFGVHKVYPNVPWQRCHYHFTKNIVEKAPKKYQIGLSSELREMFTKDTLDEATQRRDEIIKDYSDVAPDAIKCLDEGFEDSMTVMGLPEGVRKVIRTSNHIERLNGEVKRRSKVIGIFPNSASVIRLMGSVLMEENEKWGYTRRLFYSKAYNAIKETDYQELIKIAEKQQKMLKAA